MVAQCALLGTTNCLDTRLHVLTGLVTLIGTLWTVTSLLSKKRTVRVNEPELGRTHARRS